MSGWQGRRGYKPAPGADPIEGGAIKSDFAEYIEVWRHPGGDVEILFFDGIEQIRLRPSQAERLAAALQRAVEGRP